MKYCINCGKELMEDARFCSYCGTAVNGDTADKRRMVYEGDIHKCPNCGEVVESFTTNCPTCGFEFRNTQATNAVKELTQKLEKIENSRSSRQPGWSKLLDTKNRISETDQEKISLIRSFAIPNSKEDLFEFIVLASSNINIHRYAKPKSLSASERAVSDAWYSKFEQSFEKAKLTLKNTIEFEKIRDIYSKKQKEIRWAKRNRKIFLSMTIGLPIVFYVAAAVLVISSSTSFYSRDSIDRENKRLNVLVSEIYSSIEMKDYDMARAKAANLIFAGPSTEDGKQAAEKWEKTRKELLNVIANAEESVKQQESDLPQDTIPAPTYEEKTDNTDELARIPDDFYSGFTKADFSDYNSPAEDNGLGGAKIYFTGVLEKIEIRKMDESDCILGYLTDSEGNKWLLWLNLIPIVEKSHYDIAIGKEICCTGVYLGYSNLLNMPATSVSEIIILQDGTRLNGVQKILDQS